MDINITVPASLAAYAQMFDDFELNRHSAIFLLGDYALADAFVAQTEKFSIYTIIEMSYHRLFRDANVDENNPLDCTVKWSKTDNGAFIQFLMKKPNLERVPVLKILFTKEGDVLIHTGNYNLTLTQYNGVLFPEEATFYRDNKLESSVMVTHVNGRLVMKVEHYTKEIYHLMVSNQLTKEEVEAPGYVFKTGTTSFSVNDEYTYIENDLVKARGNAVVHEDSHEYCYTLLDKSSGESFSCSAYLYGDGYVSTGKLYTAQTFINDDVFLSAKLGA